MKFNDSKSTQESEPAITFTMLLKRHQGSAVLALIVFLICDLIAGSVLTFFERHSFGQKALPATTKDSADYDLASHEKLRIPHPIYHHDFRPNFTSLESWGPLHYMVRTNSLGFRDKVIREVNLEGKGRRILFIGDSFVEGNGIEYEKTFVGLIQDHLEKFGAEVFNAGVSSYAPIIYFKKIQYLIEHVGFKFDEVIVYIDMSDIQDEGETYALDPEGRVRLTYESKE